MTTIEFCESMHAGQDAEKEQKPETSREDKSSIYDVGIFRNLQSILGDNPLSWLSPFSGPGGDGLSFAKQSNSAEEEEEAVEPLEKRVQQAAYDCISEGSTSASLEGSPPLHTTDDKDIHPDPGEQQKHHEDGHEPPFHPPGSVGSQLLGEMEVVEEGGTLFIWDSKNEFKDDLRHGCDCILEASKESLSRLMWCCFTSSDERRASRSSSDGAARRGSFSARASGIRSTSSQTSSDADAASLASSPCNGSVSADSETGLSSIGAARSTTTPVFSISRTSGVITIGSDDTGLSSIGAASRTTTPVFSISGTAGVITVGSDFL